MATEPVCNNNDASLTTLPLDLLTNITGKLDSHDEVALKLTCKRMNFLIARPPLHAISRLAQTGDATTAAAGAGAGAAAATGAHEDGHDDFFLTVGVARDLIPRDGRSTPIPQSPLPFKAATTLREVEEENKDVENREVERGMELSDDEEEDDGGSVRSSNATPQRRKYKVKKNILHWTAELDSAPSSPGGMRSPQAAAGHGGGAAGGYVHSPRADSSAVPTFTLTTQ